jgi:hypothetical protein
MKQKPRIFVAETVNQNFELDLAQEKLRSEFILRSSGLWQNIT